MACIGCGRFSACAGRARGPLITRCCGRASAGAYGAKMFAPDYAGRAWRSKSAWMAVTGCASAAVICRCTPALRRRARQLLPAYGLQESPIQNPKHQTRSKPNTSRLPITPGGNLGSGHFYLAENRTFLLCVDTMGNKLDTGNAGGSL